MHILSADRAYANLNAGIRARTFRFPDKKETQFYREGAIFPKLAPRFSIPSGSTVFTIGSCFARNVETILRDHGLKVPVTEFTLPEGELPWAAPHILNEYNAGTILQRLESVAGCFEYLPEMGVEETKDGFLDLFLHISTKPVGMQRLLERRRDIANLYQGLLGAQTIIITLGLIECWYDNRFNCYLNKAPSKKFAAEHPDRFSFHRLSAEDVVARMTRAIDLLNEMGTFNILLTVSPIPVEATFSGSNAVVANSYSKSVLRLAVESLIDRFPNVDYFPSYEIVMSGGASVFDDDNVHVTEGIVRHITRHMVANYLPDPGVSRIKDVSEDDLYFEVMDLLYRDQDLAKAREVAEKLASQFSGHWYRFDAEGHVRGAENDLQGAIASTRHALELHPTFWGLQARLGHLQEQAGNVAEAEIFFRAAAASDEDQGKAVLEKFAQRNGLQLEA